MQVIDYCISILLKIFHLFFLVFIHFFSFHLFFFTQYVIVLLNTIDCNNFCPNF